MLVTPLRPLLQFGWVCGKMGNMDLDISDCLFFKRYYDVNTNPLKDRFQTSHLERSNCFICYCADNPERYYDWGGAEKRETDS